MKSSLQEVQKFAEKRAEHDKRMASYLEDLDAARPAERQIVVQVLKLMVQEVDGTRSRTACRSTRTT